MRAGRTSTPGMWPASRRQGGRRCRQRRSPIGVSSVQVVARSSRLVERTGVGRRHRCGDGQFGRHRGGRARASRSGTSAHADGERCDLLGGSSTSAIQWTPYCRSLKMLDSVAGEDAADGFGERRRGAGGLPDLSTSRRPGGRRVLAPPSPPRLLEGDRPHASRAARRVCSVCGMSCTTSSRLPRTSESKRGARAAAPTSRVTGVAPSSRSTYGTSTRRSAGCSSRCSNEPGSRSNGVSTHPTGSSPDTWPGLSDPPDGSPLRPARLLERGHAEVERHAYPSAGCSQTSSATSTSSRASHLTGADTHHVVEPAIARGRSHGEPAHDLMALRIARRTAHWKARRTVVGGDHRGWTAGSVRPAEGVVSSQQIADRPETGYEEVLSSQNQATSSAGSRTRCGAAARGAWPAVGNTRPP